MQHIPVLAQEVMRGLELKPGDTVIDGTLGLGGHAALILKATAPDGRLIGIDHDPKNLELAQTRLRVFGDRVRYIHGSFAAMDTFGETADAILFDLGFSSAHVDDPQRGFSFQTDGPLDMRYDSDSLRRRSPDSTSGPNRSLTAADIVNTWSLEELAEIFRKYGEELQARNIAQAIMSRRKHESLTSTLQLAEIVSAVVPRRGRLHPATKTFQALRITVNNELGELETGLKAMVKVLKPGGRVAIISFHSLEDRLVKDFFKQAEALTVISKKPITATNEEINANPRARSAKLRLARRS